MKNLIRYWFGFLLIVGLIFTSIHCKKDEENNDPINKIIFNPDLTYGTLKDTDGNVYKTIVIGTQTWMAENLKVIHFRNGDPIHNDTNALVWKGLMRESYCDYNNNPDSSVVYGRLYNWFAVTDYRNLAPKGWHVPSDSEWTILLNYLGGDSIAGKKLYEHSVNHWNGNRGYSATNESGFTALPAGARTTKYCYIRDFGSFWSSTQSNFFQPYYRLFGWSDIILRKFDLPQNGYSVRCVKDN